MILFSMFFSDFDSWNARVRRIQIWSRRLVGHSLGIFFGFGNECLWYRVVFVGRTRYLQWGNLVCGVQFFGATKHLSERFCPLVGWSIGRSVGWSVGALCHLIFGGFGQYWLLTLVLHVHSERMRRHVQ